MPAESDLLSSLASTVTVLPLKVMAVLASTPDTRFATLAQNAGT
jgi:hypothetical protein